MDEIQSTSELHNTNNLNHDAICQYHGLDNETQVFFYEQEFYVLSNFSSFNVWLDGIRFQTAEHAYHFSKFNYDTENEDLLKTLKELREEIRSAESAHKAFELGQKNKCFRNPNWEEIKFSVMLNILRLKVQQHEYVKKKLLQTGNRELIENSWRDDVWGWGPNKNGQNALGKLWMVIREEFKTLNELSNSRLT
jgi:ribA/ribD-fused uncharacterized protein